MRGSAQVGLQYMAVLSGFGYWVQGFRCFPWLALNFHLVHDLNLHPSLLQLVHHSGNLPMVAKPFYGILSDSIYIGGAHRIPYIIIGGPILGLIPAARETLPTLLACILLGNLGASIAEVANDALVTEYGQKHRKKGLQSYAFMALAVGGILGNLLGGCFLLKTAPRNMFLIFAGLLAVQLAISSTSREESLGISEPSFLASTLCLSSIFSGFLGVGLSSMMGITAGDYSRLPMGILIQFIAALLPLGWIQNVPSYLVIEKERKK